MTIHKKKQYLKEMETNLTELENIIYGCVFALVWAFWLYGFSAGWYFDEDGYWIDDETTLN